MYETKPLQTPPLKHIPRGFIQSVVTHFVPWLLADVTLTVSRQRSRPFYPGDFDKSAAVAQPLQYEPHILERLGWLLIQC